MLCRNAVVDKARDKYIILLLLLQNFTNNKKWLLVGVEFIFNFRDIGEYK